MLAVTVRAGVCNKALATGCEISRRSLWLLVFGLLHAALVFPGEILAGYGLTGLLFGWLLFRSDRAVKIAT